MNKKSPFKSVNLLRKAAALQTIVVEVEGRLSKINVQQEIRLTSGVSQSRIEDEVELYYFWRRNLAEARITLQTLERKLNRERSLFDQAIRAHDNNPETEQTLADGDWDIKSKVDTQKSVRKRTKKVAEARAVVEHLTAIIATLDVKHKMMNIRAGNERRKHERNGSSKRRK